MSARPGRARTLSSRMLIWLSLMLLPLIGGGVAGIAQQQRDLAETRATAERTGSTFLGIERAHRALHAGEEVATARARHAGDPAADRALHDASLRVEAAIGQLERLVPAAHRASLRRVRALWARAASVASRPGTRAATDREVRWIETAVFAAQAELEQVTDTVARDVRDGRGSAGDARVQTIALVVSFLISSGIAIAIALHLRAAIGRPLALLRASARRLGRGDLDHRVELNSFAEFAEVADSLNAMATRLADSQRELSRRASHDELTGLANRGVLFERVERALGALDAGRAIAVLFIDVDDFKAVNDSLGHTVGDGVLATLAPRLRDAVRPGDSIARLGGDEFAVLLEDMAEPADAERVAERVLLALSAPMIVGGLEVSLGGSVGVAVATAQDRMTAEELLRAADLAMYAAKRMASAGTGCTTRRCSRERSSGSSSKPTSSARSSATSSTCITSPSSSSGPASCARWRRSRAGTTRSAARSRRTSSSAWPSAPA
jgi:diguanylate cyclase (GGDEF)-like protein